MFAQESVMDVEKEREAFEATSSFSIYINKVNSDGNKYTPIYYKDLDYAQIMSFGWLAWQAAKTQAVPQWISTSDRMPDEGEEVLVHSLGQVRQVTRDSKWAGGFKERNCYGWQAAYDQSHWMPKSIGLPEEYHFYYKMMQSKKP